MTVCGIWQGNRRLVAVIATDDGALRPPITAPDNQDNAHHLLDYLAAIDIGILILSEHSHTLIAKARALNLDLRLAPHDLLQAIRTAAGLIHRSPRDTASLLARWYLTPTLRLHLRRFRAIAIHQKQIALF